VPLRNAKDVDYEGGEEDEQRANARGPDWKPYPESCAFVSMCPFGVAWDAYGCSILPSSRR
jgi:hypothetical protein